MTPLRTPKRNRQIAPRDNVDIANEGSRHALGSLIPQRSWMTSPSRTLRPSTPPSQRRTRSLVVDAETTAQTQIASHVLTAIPPSTQLNTTGPTNTVPTNRTTNPRPHGELTPGNLEARTNGEGADATSTNEPLTTAIPIGSAITPAASHPESESDLTGPAQAQSQDNNELTILVLTICSSIPLRGSIFSQRIHLQFAQQKYSQVLESLYNSPALAAYNDLKDNNSLNGHRLSILTEAIQSEDYYFLALNQAICEAQNLAPEARSEYESTLLYLGHFFAAEGLAPELMAFCVRFPFSHSLLKKLSLSAEEASTHYDRGLQRISQHMYSSADKIRTTWPTFLASCKYRRVLPLSQDLVRTFGVFSVSLQRAIFGALVRGLELEEASVLAAQKLFTESQARLFAHQVYNLQEACATYRQYHSILNESQSSTQQPAITTPLQLDPEYFTVEEVSTTSQFSKDTMECHGTERYNPGSFRPCLPIILHTRSEHAQILINSMRLGPIQLTGKPFTQIYTFFVTEPEFLSLATKRQRNDRTFLHFTPGSKGFRLRMCHSEPGKEWSTIDWLKQPPTGASSIYFTLNGHMLELPNMVNATKFCPYDLSEMIIPGNNELVVQLCGTSQDDKQDPSVAFAVERISGVATEQIIDRCLKDQVVPVEPIKGHFKRRLQPADPDDDDLVVVDPTLTITLTEPLSNSKIFDVPARGKGCSHDQPFDLRTFFENRPKVYDFNLLVYPNPVCPICKADVSPTNIVIDGFLVEVRKQLESMGRLDVRSIAVDQDGNWKIKEMREESKDPHGRDRRQSAAVVMEIDDDD